MPTFKILPLLSGHKLLGLALNSFVWAWLKTPSVILHNFIYLAERMVTQTIVKFICFFSLETWWSFLFLFSSLLYTFTLNSLTVCVHTHMCVYWYTENQRPFLFPLKNWIENVIRLCFENISIKPLAPKGMVFRILKVLYQTKLYFSTTRNHVIL